MVKSDIVFCFELSQHKFQRIPLFC